MKLLITGVNGFVGPHLARHLANVAPEAEIWGQAWGASGRDRLAELAPRARIVDAELGELDSVQAIFDTVQPDTIFHLAAASSVAGSWSRPAHIFQINAIGQIHLFEALRSRGLQPLVVVASSAEVYGSTDATTISEDAPLAPISPYGVSKAAQDLIAAQYHHSRTLPTVRLRLFNHTGPGQGDHFVTSSFARQIARIEAGMAEPRLEVGNLETIRDFSDVGDVVRAYWLAATRGEAGAVYNVCSGHGVSIRSLLDILLAQSRVPIEVGTDPQRLRASDVPRLVGNPERFRAATGWQASTPIEETLARLLAWWRSHS